MKRWIAAITLVVAISLAVLFFAPREGRVPPTQETKLAASTASAPQETGQVSSAVPSHVGNVGTATHSRHTPAEWAAEFRAADDYGKFVSDALPSALAGDGRAAIYIGDALSVCALIIKNYRGSADPEAQLNQELANSPKAPQWVRDRQAKQTHRCQGLAQKDPLKDLPVRDGGYTPSYWYGQALADGDALAQGRAAASQLADISVSKDMSESAKAEKLKSADEYLRTAIESGDPDALYFAGMLLSDGRYSKNPLNGVAVALAACDLGHDCSAKNPENVFSVCAQSGGCPADADLAYYMQTSLGADQYAEAYALAQTVKQAVQAGDWDTVMTKLKIDQRL